MKLNKSEKKKIKKVLIMITLALIIMSIKAFDNTFFNEIKSYIFPSYSIENIPEYNKKGYIMLNNNNPSFKETEITTKEFEYYGNLDILGRCTQAYANVSKNTMPTKEREAIGMIKPSGWRVSKYDFIEGKYLYNRCHLIGYQLTGENANKRNLITCTKYTNATTMLMFENKVAKYIKETNNHVMYRVTPIFKDTELVARGIQMEAYSVEDNGKLKFNVYVYNVQDKIKIDYQTGNNYLSSK